MADIKSDSKFALSRKYFLLPNSGGQYKRIGIIEPNYGLERVSYSMAVDGYRYYRTHALRTRFLDRGSNFFDQTPFIFGSGIDLTHTWNSIPRNGNFITTFEMEFPRLFGTISKSQMEYAIKRVMSNNCKMLLPLSNAARDYALRRFEELKVFNIHNKMKVFRGAIAERSIQPVFDRLSDSKQPLKVLFVGSEGLRKGIYPVVRAVEKIINMGENINITIVGNFTQKTYLIPETIFDRSNIVSRFLDKPWLKHFPYLSNESVRSLMDDHHILVFPTFDESLGWVPMEAAMSGMPTISTNVFAIPEFVKNRATGWIIPLDIDGDGRWQHRGNKLSAKSFIAAEDYIEEELVKIFLEILNNRSFLSDFGAAAYRLAMAKYSSRIASKQIKNLYDCALDC